MTPKVLIGLSVYKLYCDAVQDQIGVGGPYERLGILVAFLQSIHDCASQFRNTLEGAVAVSLVRDFREETLYLIESDCVGQREVNSVFRMAGEPALNGPPRAEP